MLWLVLRRFESCRPYMSWEKATGHNVCAGKSRGYVDVWCPSCHKMKSMFAHRLRDVAPERKREAQMYIFAYFLNEPCEQDEESLLSTE